MSLLDDIIEAEVISEVCDVVNTGNPIIDFVEDIVVAEVVDSLFNDD